MDYCEQYCDTYTVSENTASYSTYTVYDDDVYARPDTSYEALALRHYMWYNVSVRTCMVSVCIRLALGSASWTGGTVPVR